MCKGERREPPASMLIFFFLVRVVPGDNTFMKVWISQ